MYSLWQKRWFQVGIGGFALVLFLLWHSMVSPPVHAQLDTSTSLRLSRIETNIRSLQSEIQSLETALIRAQRSSQSGRVIVQEMPLEQSQEGAIAPPLHSPAPNPLDLEAAQAELMFDQLATLVIETRQDMFALQDKVEALEQRINQ